MCRCVSTFVLAAHRLCDGKTHRDGKAVVVPSGRGVLEKHLLLAGSGVCGCGSPDGCLLGVASSCFPGHGDVNDLTSVPCSQRATAVPLGGPAQDFHLTEENVL